MRAKRMTIATVLLVSMALAACEGGGNQTSTSAGTSSGPIGVAECDEYVNKYEQCASKNTAAASRDQVASNVAAMRASWKQAAAANPAARTALSQGCQRALATAKTAMAQHGCAW